MFELAEQSPAAASAQGPPGPALVPVLHADISSVIGTNQLVTRQSCLRITLSIHMGQPTIRRKRMLRAGHGFCERQFIVQSEFVDNSVFLQ
jgi:hypothetical protein